MDIQIYTYTIVHIKNTIYNVWPKIKVILDTALNNILFLYEYINNFTINYKYYFYNIIIKFSNI